MNKPKRIKNLIIGAGPAGMACAMELHKAHRKSTIVEKQSQVGGLSRTYKFGKFHTDNGPHRFFSKNPYLYQFIEELVGEDWIKVDRFTRFYIDGKFYQYPIRWQDVAKNLGPIKIIKVLLDYLYARYAYRNSTLDNFYDYVIAHFGKSLAQLNIINYTEKIWGLPCQQLSSLQAKQRIKDLSIKTIIKNLIRPNQSNPKSLVDQFYYPKYGTGTIYEQIQNHISSTTEFLLEDQPSQLNHKNFKVTQVKLKSGKIYSPQNIVSTIPITEVINLLSPKPPQKILQAINKLRYRSQVYLFITLDKPRITPDQWIYFPDSHIPFGRVSEMKNFSSQMSPENQTSLFVEYFCWENDDIWKMSKNQLLKISLPHFQQLNFFSKQDIIRTYHFKVPNVYPVYELKFQEHLKTITNYLDKFSNLYYIGRQGRFSWNNQDHSLEMGMLTAKSIIENKRYSVEHIAQETSYQEIKTTLQQTS